jgi:hypothetical protein
VRRSPVLTEERQRLVRDNIGLVAVPIRRIFGVVRQPSRDREWDDLFQEGCLGLMQAAATFDPASNIAFTTYALMRIQNAVCRAATRAFQTVARAPDQPAKRVPLAHIAAPGRRDAAARDEKIAMVETIGVRLRHKYERAVRRAAEAVARRRAGQGRPTPVLALLMRDRYLVPDEDFRVSLRQIARNSGTAYASAVRADKALAAETRRLLRADPEFRELQRLARSHPEGLETPCNESVDRRLVHASADEMVRAMRAGPAARRARLLDLLEQLTSIGWDDVVRHRLHQMPPAHRERLFHTAESLDEPKTTPRRRKRRRSHNPTRDSTDGSAPRPVRRPNASPGSRRDPRASRCIISE